MATTETTTRNLPSQDSTLIPRELKTCVRHGFLPGCSFCELEEELLRIFSHPTLAERICRALNVQR
jgi:hypothetical protein